MDTDPPMALRGQSVTACEERATGRRRALLASPIGPLHVLVEADGAISRIAFDGAGAVPADSLPPAATDDGVVCHLARQLDEYFAGVRQRFDDLLLRPAGSAFQQRVWRALRDVPYGSTLSYAELAARVGGGTHARPVGGANGRNPLPIVIPCHRIIGADGSLTGFGGGLARKRFLLDLEGVRYRG